ncbi:MAG: hypothetical protein B6D38_12890 [Anaerolineae bacterium UTCFX1]|nr:MAG: hypothetical protein B6D38_12890 [Anaerolineae bacterium UTCFX1]
MQAQSYIPGTKPADTGPLSRFLPPLAEGTLAHWLSVSAAQDKPGSWLLDPFGFSPYLILEAARAGYRLLVTVNNPIARFLLEIAANPPSGLDFNAALAELESVKKGDQRLGAHLQPLYQTTCEKCNAEIQADYFLWRKEADAPHARVYTCLQCNDSGERIATQQDIDRAKQIAATDGLHRSRSFERVAKLDDDDRVYAEEAIQHYLPRPLYFLTTVINRIDGLNLTPERKRALNALILVACDAGNTLWDHPPTRPRPKQLNIPSQFREHNLWKTLERGLTLWSKTGSPVAIEAWPKKIPESGGVCIYEGRLKELAREVKKEIPIAAVIGSLPRPNQAFWTLSALWAGWLWGREAVEPYKLALRRRRYDWAWNATALHAAFSHLFELLPLGTPFFGFMPEPEPPFLTSALTAAGAAGFDLKSVALRTEHDPIQILWNRGEHLKREANEQDVAVAREAIHAYLVERGEPASYLHVHAAALIALAEAHALKNKTQEFDEALRGTNALIQSALSEDERFVHYSSGESVDTGLWGNADFSQRYESLADRVEVAIVTFLQKKPDSIYLEIENNLYPRFAGLLTPSKAMIYAVLDSYAEREGASMKLRAEDVASARRNERDTIIPMLELVGKRLGYSTNLADKNHVWAENNSVQFAFYVLASALVGRAMDETPYAPEQTILVIPGGRASLIAYKAGRDPALAARLKNYRLLKYRLLRAMLEVPVLTREMFEEQIANDPLEKSKSQMMMF